MSLFDLKGKTAIITGSSRGIGKAIAERLSEQGARVAISSRKREACDAVAAAINTKHGADTAISAPANISSKADLQGLVDETTQRLGAPGIVVCNAATNPHYGPMSDIADEQFRKILDNNIISSHWLIQMCLPGMIQQNGGSIVIISSIGGMIGSAAIGAYNISKAADFQLARNLAVELGKYNIRVNCIAPGLVKTDFARALWENPANLKAATSGTPLQRIGEPDDIAGAAVFLASEASAFMTGHTIVMDGGATINSGLLG